MYTGLLVEQPLGHEAFLKPHVKPPLQYYRSGRKTIGRLPHYAKQTYDSRVRLDRVCDTLNTPIIKSIVDVNKITTLGGSGSRPDFQPFRHMTRVLVIFSFRSAT